MQLGNGSFDLINSVTRSQGLPLSGLRMVELGNQHLRRSTLGAAVSAKRLFEVLGVEHVSIDWNGKDGALQYDLGQPIPDAELLGSFDLLTNFGTAEHVDNQFDCWKNVHDLLRVGGIALHLAPLTGHPTSHCEFYYDEAFFRRFAELADYEVLELYELRGWLAVAMKKRADVPFPEAMRGHMPLRQPRVRPNKGFRRRLRRWKKKLGLDPEGGRSAPRRA